MHLFNFTVYFQIIYRCFVPIYINNELPWWLSSKEPVCSIGDWVSLRGSGRSSGEGNGNPLQYSCLGNPINSLVDYSPQGRKRVGHNSNNTNNSI